MAPSLRDRTWPRFLKGPDSELVEMLYVPGLSSAVRYDRCCAYFSSSVLAAAARGFSGLITRLVAMGDSAPRPAVRLIVNEELNPEDVRAMTESSDLSMLEELLMKHFKPAKDLLETRRLEMLAWLVKSGLLDIRVGVMRQGQGILHAKFGLMYDTAGDAVVFNGSGNESAYGLRANYERLELSTSWADNERFREYEAEFEALWQDTHPDVHTVTLPEAVRKKLIRMAPPEPPIVEPQTAIERRKAAMLWRFIAEAPYLKNGASSCEATAPIEKLWPHQMRVIEEVADAWPEGRLLCDEVGMGKTIEAIMILLRLMAGRGVRRALLLLPAGLTSQWQEELREKGGLIVPRLQNNDTLVWPDGRIEKAAALAEVLNQDLLIMSRETARTEGNRALLLTAKPWDLVLLDESHAARRAKQEEGEFNAATLLLELLRELQVRQKMRGLLLLSATPMQTAPWEPWDLLAVLGEGGAWLSEFTGVRSYYNTVRHLKSATPVPSDDARRSAWLLSSEESQPDPPQGFNKVSSYDDGERRLRFVNPALKQQVADWLRHCSPLTRRMHRNTRHTLRGYYNRGVITDPPPVRTVADYAYDFDPPNGAERRVYDAVGHYIERRFEELEGEKPGKGFVMTIYRRRAASSPHALKCSLERRLNGLRRVIAQRTGGGYIEQIEIPAGLIDDDLPQDIDSREIPASFPTNPEEAKREAVEVAQLLEQLNALGATDTKRDRFFGLLRQLKSEGRPVLVFTEYTDTMDYLRDSLSEYYGNEVASYSGGGGGFYQENGWRTVSKKEITDALKNGGIKLLICTDAASEGLNLQAASALVNYDLPWNPSRVEQRIGRIDRIGQRERIVKIYNFFLKNSIDEKVYKALEMRCGLFTHFVGPMQPVLALAKVMLNRPKEFSLQEIEKIAKEAGDNYLNAETYLESDPIPLSGGSPAVTKTDLMNALSLLDKEQGVYTSGKVGITLKGLSNKNIRLALDSDTLDSDLAAIPLTALSPQVTQIADRLSHAGELLPFVVASHRSGPFRSSCALWLNPTGFEPIESLAQLKQRLAEWDGSLLAAERVFNAHQYALGEARKVVTQMKLLASQKLVANINHQLEAARIRTARELGRLLKSLDPNTADLEALLATQIARGGQLADKLREARMRLGSDFLWSGYLLWELSQFAQDLSPNERRSRLSGSSVDAALSDYRWQAISRNTD